VDEHPDERENSRRNSEPQAEGSCPSQLVRFLSAKFNCGGRADERLSTLTTMSIIDFGRSATRRARLRFDGLRDVAFTRSVMQCRCNNLLSSDFDSDGLRYASTVLDVAHLTSTNMTHGTQKICRRSEAMLRPLLNGAQDDGFKLGCDLRIELRRQRWLLMNVRADDVELRELASLIMKGRLAGQHLVKNDA